MAARRETIIESIFLAVMTYLLTYMTDGSFKRGDSKPPAGASTNLDEFSIAMLTLDVYSISMFRVLCA
jgi:hypothetical protein